MARSVSLSVQLLLTFVGLILGTAAVLTTVAYRASRATLETDALRNVSLATRTREQSVTQLFNLRQQRAEGLLASAQSLCGEPAGGGRLAWSEDCVQTMVDDLRKSEHALGALLTYRNRSITRSGAAVTQSVAAGDAVARVIRLPAGAIEYAVTATLGPAALKLQFGHDEVAALFEDRAGLGPSGEVFLLDGDGQFLTPPRKGASMTVPPDAAGELAENCRAGADRIVGADYRGVKTISSFRPVAAVDSACIGARVDYDEALAPAERLRGDLVARAAWFVLLGGILSLVAAQWIAAPVRSLATSAGTLQTGRFDRPIPVAGPSEVRALGRAFNAMANDLAELVAKEQAARRDAEAANRSKDQFLAAVSHELRTPLSAILGWSHMLRAGHLPPERVRHGLQVIERNARAQHQLIEDLLDVSRIVSNRLRLVREPVRLGDVVDAALDAVRPQAAAKGVEIETSLTPAAVVLGDPRRLEQIIWNLVFNAVKFTQPSGRVRLELKRINRQAVLSVSDTGVGISSAFLPHVFEWFRQADSKLRTQAGLGLGLGIVRHLVQLHGGSVHAESPGEGHGATFVVKLPIFEGATAQAGPQRASEPPRDQRSRALEKVRVLVVEDDEDTREILRVTLENAGASVDAVASAREARQKMLEDAPDVLISDIRMPEEDGYSLVQSLRAARVKTPAIALTAYARREDAAAAEAAGFQLHLPKPIDAGRLIDAVATVVGSQ
jgi:signal transduction histidine kinase/CheY-like chemotaxis protein